MAKKLTVTRRQNPKTVFCKLCYSRTNLYGVTGLTNVRGWLILCKTCLGDLDIDVEERDEENTDAPDTHPMDAVAPPIPKEYDFRTYE